MHMMPFNYFNPFLKGKRHSISDLKVCSVIVSAYLIAVKISLVFLQD